MALAPGSRVHRIRRLRYIDGRAVMFVAHDLTRSLTLIYQQHYRIGYSRSRFDIYPTAAYGSVACHLNLTEGRPAA